MLVLPPQNIKVVSVLRGTSCAESSPLWSPVAFSVAGRPALAAFLDALTDSGVVPTPGEAVSPVDPRVHPFLSLVPPSPDAEAKEREYARLNADINALLERIATTPFSGVRAHFTAKLEELRAQRDALLTETGKL